MDEPVIYEVTCRVRRDVLEAWSGWIGHHVEEVLRCPGMLGATVARAEDEGDEAVIVCSYRVESRRALDRYIAERAPALRADGVQRWGDRQRASRRVMAVLLAGSSQSPRPEK